VNEETTYNVRVPQDKARHRLDKVLAEALPALSRSRLKALIEAGRVTRSGAAVTDPAAKVGAGDSFTVSVPAAVPAVPSPQAIPLDVVYEDDDLIVIDKPAGLVVHPAPGHRGGTLVNALLAHCGASLSGIGGVGRPGIVHRLDRDTSGLMVVAKTDAAHRSLSEQFADHGRTGVLERAYLAFVWGAPRRAAGTIDRSVGRHPTDRLRQAIRENGGRRAVTHYEIVRRFGPKSAEHPIVSLVRCRLETGRTHQVRVHMASIHCPLLGDALYGAGYRSKVSLLPENAQQIVSNLNRQALHASVLAFAHPTDGRVLRFESPLPPDLEALELSLIFP
jgi:23S rRNA pseudouridine1911/1915/1917 synthase